MARQSSDASSSTTATNAIDGAGGTESQTQNLPDSFWEMELNRVVRMSRVEVVVPANMNGVVLRIQDLRDRTLFQASLAGTTAGGTWSTNLPTPVNGRIVRLALENGQQNGSGNFQVRLSEVRLFGDPSPVYGPATLGVSATVMQSSTNSIFEAGRALDGFPSTYIETLNVPDSYWLMTFDADRPIETVEVVNRTDSNSVRMDGLILQVLNSSSNEVYSTPLYNPGTGNNLIVPMPFGTVGRHVKIGLFGNTNGQGNYIVSFADVNILNAPNLAQWMDSYMTRSIEGLLPSYFVNDGHYGSTVWTHTSTVDGYFEVDLATTRALYSVRVVAASGMQSQVSHTTLSLFDEDHQLIFQQHLAGTSETFDIPLPGPVLARYVRVGLEYKEFTSPNSTSRYFGLREIQAFGRASNEVNLVSFSAASTQVVAGASTTLNWQEDGLYQLHLYPNIGSVGSNTMFGGSGSRVVTPPGSTEYVLVGSNYSGNFVRHITVNVNGTNLPARISEFVANNKLSFRDGRKEYPDWIELHNPNNTVLNLGGYYLSDSPANPTKWAFPSGVILAPHGYLTVFASDSGTNQTYDSAGFLHANFALNNDGESVILTAPNGTTTVDSITNFPPQREDLAYGRTLNGVWKFLEPTPNGPNVGAVYDGWLTELDFSHKRGWHTNGFSLFITNSNPSSQVYYSLDGREPWIPYSGPLFINNVTSVRASVVRPGYKSPRVKTHSYLFLEGVVNSPVINATYRGSFYVNRLRQGLVEIPTLCVTVPPVTNIPNTEFWILNHERPERQASVEIFMPDGSNIQENCGLTHFGGAFATLGTVNGNPYVKKSYQLKFRKEYGAAKLKFPLFQGFDYGVLAKDTFDEIDLHAGNHDMSSRGFYLSHRFAADTLLDMGSLNPHGRFVHLYVNGVYRGQFDAHERLTDSFLSEYLGGAKEDYVSVKGNDNGSGGQFILGVPEPPNRSLWETVRANRFSYFSVTNALDVSHLIDFMLLWNWSPNSSFEAEFRAAGPINPGSGFKFWVADADGLLSRSSSVNLTLARTNISGPGLLFGALLSENNPEFKMLLADRIYKHFFNRGALTPAALEARMNLRATEMTNSIVAEAARWGFRSPESWASEVQAARLNWLPYRSTNILNIMRNAGWYPTVNVITYNQYGGVITNGFPLMFSGGGGLIYYTLDGSDPRLPGGGISPSAIGWNGHPIILTSNVTVRVRVKLGPTWSALGDASFVIGPVRQPQVGDLVFSEIHYNPAGSDDFEFVEIYNTSTNLLNISGTRLMDGLEFLFPNGSYLPPGGLILVVENLAAFNARYRTNSSPYYHPDIPVAGVWSGQLSNSGERLALVASNGVELAAVSYETSGQWPSRADGAGSSLELRSPAAVTSTNATVLGVNLNRGQNWRSSVLYHGSPGQLDTQPRNLVISEVVAHTDVGVDWIELQNTTGDSIQLSNYFLSDNYDQPFRYGFPGVANIPAGGYLIRTANQLGFGFSELGSDILLIEASGTNILRYVDTVDIPAVDREVPFGRYTRSDFVTDFTELRVKTQGTDNALPLIGPIIISEIMYNPTNGNAEFIELVNITSTNVPLYDPLRPTNVWELSDAVDFKFPAGQQLAPGAVAIVCATNPAAFRAQYGVSMSVPVYGPWTGALNNAGEALRLRRPGVPEPNGFVPYYRVDRVRYEPVPPWPTEPYTNGVSLERITLEGYGNDPGNWQASVPGGTPGTFVGNRPPHGVTAVDGDTTGFEGMTFNLTLAGTDPDEPWQSVQLAAHALPLGATFNTNNGAFTWTPSETDGPGVHFAQFVVRDNGLVPMVSTQSLLLTVLESNQPPVVDPIADFLYPALVRFSKLITASDPDLPEQILSFSALGLPGGVEINPATGEISGSAGTPGIYSVTVRAEDDQLPPLAGTNGFTLTIVEPFVLQGTVAGPGGQPQFSFHSLAGESYDVQYTTELNPPDWKLLQHISNAPGGWVTLPAPPSAAQNFIRVIWLRSP